MKVSFLTMKQLIVITLFIFFAVFAHSAECQIRTVRCFPLGHPEAEPVIELGSGQQLVFSFDDLSADDHTYTYKILHCDPDWNPSGLSPFRYLDGFFSQPVEDYAYSYHADTEYTHFSLLFPNHETGIKVSGNYLLQVYDDDRPDSAVISQCFSVLERKTVIHGSVVSATRPQYLYTSQQVNFTVENGSLPVYNPVRDFRVHVTQNQDPNTRRALTPTFVRQGQLVYEDGVENLFDGLSPFRHFQTVSFSFYDRYVKEVVKEPDGKYHFILEPATVPQRYVPVADERGNYVIDAEQVQQPDVEADYAMVHFALLYPGPLPDAEVYVYGKFSGWELSPAFRMDYDARHKAYICDVELKQGRYDYQFAVLDKTTGEVDLHTLQNNFYQTINEYNVRIYFYDSALGAYRFVGYQNIIPTF